MKNIFKQPQKGISPQEIKRKNRFLFFVNLGFFLYLSLLFFLKIISFEYYFLGWVVSIGFYGFYSAYLAIKYKMMGGLGSFPMISGKVAFIFGIVLLLLTTLILILSPFALIILKVSS